MPSPRPKATLASVELDRGAVGGGQRLDGEVAGDPLAGDAERDAGGLEAQVRAGGQVADGGGGRVEREAEAAGELEGRAGADGDRGAQVPATPAALRTMSPLIAVAETSAAGEREEAAGDRQARRVAGLLEGEAAAERLAHDVQRGVGRLDAQVRAGGQAERGGRRRVDRQRERAGDVDVRDVERELDGDRADDARAREAEASPGAVSSASSSVPPRLRLTLGRLDGHDAGGAGDGEVALERLAGDGERDVGAGDADERADRQLQRDGRAVELERLVDRRRSSC